MEFLKVLVPGREGQDIDVLINGKINGKVGEVLILGEGLVLVSVDLLDTNGVINKKLNDRDKPLRRLIINVNAGVFPEDTSCKSPNAPQVASVIKYTMATSMDILFISIKGKSTLLIGWFRHWWKRIRR